MNLTELPRGACARVHSIATADPELETKLREIGFAEGDEVEVVHFGPLAKKPICARLNRTLIALRTSEAAAIIVEPKL